MRDGQLRTSRVHCSAASIRNLEIACTYTAANSGMNTPGMRSHELYIVGRVCFGAADLALDISAPDISAPGLFGARIFILDSLFCSYVVSVCSSLRSR